MSDPLLGLAIFGGALALLALGAAFLARSRATARSARERSLRDSVTGRQPAEVLPVFAADGGAERLAVLQGGKLAVQENPERPPAALEVSGVAFVQDAGGRYGLRLTAGSKTWLVTGLAPMMRAYGQLRVAGKSIEYELAGTLGERAKATLDRLHSKEREILGQWLVRTEELQEIPLDVLDGVDYRGTVKTPGARTQARLLVTNFRLGLLAQTQVSVQRGNVIERTTHFNVIGYPMPMAERVNAARDEGIRQGGWLWGLTYEAGRAPAEEQPRLVLTEAHGAALLPVSLSGRSLAIAETAPRAGRLASEAIWGGIGYGILWAILAGVPVWAWWGAHGGDWFWLEDWIPFVFAGGALAGGALRALGAWERYVERKADAELAAAAPA